MDPLIEAHPVYPIASKYAFDIVPASAEFTRTFSAQEARDLLIWTFMAGVMWAAEQEAKR